MDKKHTLLCIMGESACGKDTLVNQLCERNNYSKLISYTTRPRRDNEGNTHIFVDEDIYFRMREDGQIAAYTNINNVHYWSTIEQICESDIYIIDPLGVQALKQLNIPNLRLVTIYINVPENIRKERAIQRGDDMTIYRSRCLSERDQFRQLKRDANFDYAISNSDAIKTYSIIKWITNVECLWKNHIIGDENG